MRRRTSGAHCQSTPRAVNIATDRTMDTDNKENVHRPRFTVRHQRHRAPRMRHHNPGTRYIPVEKRIDVLQAIEVKPPTLTDRTMPKDPRIKKERDDSGSHRQSHVHLRPPLSAVVVKDQYTQWQTPIRLDAEPETRHLRQLTPVPYIQYGGEFEIIPGDAYSSVPLYINRDLPWELREIDTVTIRRVHYDREGSQDPRRSILRVELTRLPLTIYCPRELRVMLTPLIRDLRVRLARMPMPSRDQR